MNKQKGYCPSKKVSHPKKHQKEPWLGNIDDHEPTKQVTREDVNP